VNSFGSKPPLPDPLEDSPVFQPMGKTSKLLRKLERNIKDPSRASTKGMTVKLEKVLAV
jgi:hypothetical protein